MAANMFTVTTRANTTSGRRGALVARTAPMTFTQALKVQPKLQAKWNAQAIVVTIEPVVVAKSTRTALLDRLSLGGVVATQLCATAGAAANELEAAGLAKWRYGKLVLTGRGRVAAKAVRLMALTARNTNGFRALASLQRAALDTRIAEIEGGGLDDGRVFLHLRPGYIFAGYGGVTKSVGTASELRAALQLIEEVPATGPRVVAAAPVAAKRITAAHINRELRALGLGERLVQGRGYVYFVDGDAHTWRSSSIAVCYVADLVAATLAETMVTVLRERTYLANL